MLDMKAEYVRREWWINANTTTVIVADESLTPPTNHPTESSAPSKTKQPTQQTTLHGREDDPGIDPEDDAGDICSISCHQHD